MHRHVVVLFALLIAAAALHAQDHEATSPCDTSVMSKTFRVVCDWPNVDGVFGLAAGQPGQVTCETVGRDEAGLSWWWEIHRMSWQTEELIKYGNMISPLDSPTPMMDLPEPGNYSFTVVACDVGAAEYGEKRISPKVLDIEALSPDEDDNEAAEDNNDAGQDNNDAGQGDNEADEDDNEADEDDNETDENDNETDENDNETDENDDETAENDDETPVDGNAPNIHLDDTTVSAERETPRKFALEQNYPNPFNASTSIAYTLAVPARARIVLYDMRGQEVGVLAEGFREAGRHEGWHDFGTLPSGAYIYALKVENRIETKRMLLIK